MASAAAQVPVLPVCDLCGSREEVSWFCQDCQESLCNRCKIAHQGGRKTKNDEIVPIAEVKVQSSPKIVPILCQEHKTKICELYCKRCEQLICSQCLDRSHKSHEFYSVEKLIETKTSELDDFEKSLHDQLLSFDSLISEESQQYSKFISHVDKVITELKDGTDEIIQEFTKTRDKHISQLNELKKTVDQKYKTTCNHYQTKTSDIRKTVDDVKSAKMSGNADIMMKIVNEIKQKDPSIEILTVSKLPFPNFQYRSCHPQSILQLDIPDNEIMPSQKLSVMSISQPATQPTLDMSNVKVGVHVQVQDKSGQVRAIIPTDNNNVWVAVYPDCHLTLVNCKGRIIRTSRDVGGEIWDAVSYFTSILCTTWHGHCIMRVSQDGDSVAALSDLSPFFTTGLCITSDKDILVRVMAKLHFNDVDSKVIRLNGRGEITQEIKNKKGEELFSYPVRITSPDTGDTVVVDKLSPDEYRLVCTDASGGYRYTWIGQVGGKKLQNVRLSRVSNTNNSTYITARDSHCVYVLDRNGKAEWFMLKKKYGIKKPVAITIDKSGQLWLGCHGAKLYMLK